MFVDPVCSGNVVCVFVDLVCSGNVVCVFVFNQKSVELKPCFSNILKCLSIFDSLFLVNIFAITEY